MQLYDMIANSNRQIEARIAELDGVEQSNSLERNIRFERLKEDILQIYEIKRRSFYATLLRYPQTHEAIDHVQHLQVAVSGMLEALSRGVIVSEEWEGLYSTLKERVATIALLEEEEIGKLAKCYFTPEDEKKMMEEMEQESHFLNKNRRLENAAEEGFDADYTQYKKAPDNPGKSHLPPKRWRMGTA